MLGLLSIILITYVYPSIFSYLTLCLPVLMFLGGACCSCRYVDKLKQEKSQLAQSSPRPGGTAENPIYVRAHIIIPYNVYPRSRPSFKCKSGIGFVSKSKSIWVRRWRAGDVLGDKGKVVSQLLRQGQRLLHLMIVGSDTEAAGAENGFLTRGKMWLLIEVGLSLILHILGNTSSIANKLAKLRRHASRVHFAKKHFG